MTLVSETPVKSRGARRRSANAAKSIADQAAKHTAEIEFAARRYTATEAAWKAKYPGAEVNPGPQPAKSQCLKWIRHLVDAKAQFRVRDGVTILLTNWREVARSDVTNRAQWYDILEALCRTKDVDAVWDGLQMRFVKMPVKSPVESPPEPALPANDMPSTIEPVP